MKNILGQRASQSSYGRIAFVKTFVSDSDVYSRRCLDIGCGFGWQELEFIKRGAKQVDAVEISKEDIMTAKMSVRDKRVRFEVGSAIDLPFKHEVFNTVVCWDVIEHIPKNTEPQMFQEVSRVLKRNGAFYLSTPFAHPISMVFDPAWWLIGHRHYTISSLRSLALRHGFQTEIAAVKGKWWETLGILDMYIAKWLFHRLPFMEAYVGRKQDEEYAGKDGFATVFCKFRKL